MGRSRTVSKVCAVCGKTFESRPDRGKYCSRACMKKGQIRHPVVMCAACGEHPVRPGRGKYCSQACMADAFRVVVPERQCGQCGKSFTPKYGRKSRQLYCSPACGGLTRRRRVTYACATCGEPQEISVSDAASGRGRYCSQTCRFGRPVTGPIGLLCARCGKPFTVYVSQGAERRRFCRRSCRYEGPATVVTPCAMCGEPVKAYRSRIAAGAGKTCGRHCLIAWRRRHRPRRVCQRPGCHRVFYPYPGQVRAGGGLYCSLRCVRLAKAPRQFKCRACGTFFLSRAWRRPRYCSYACANSRPRPRDPLIVARNVRIMELRAQGMKAPAIAAQLAENPAWITSPAAIRQVIHRAG